MTKENGARFHRVAQTYDHGRGEFTFRGLALGQLAYGRTDKDRMLTITHLPSGKVVKRLYGDAAQHAREYVIGLQDVIDWTLPESKIVNADNGAKIRDAFAKMGAV